jgi:hypothetical protein
MFSPRRFNSKTTIASRFNPLSQAQPTISGYIYSSILSKLRPTLPLRTQLPFTTRIPPTLTHLIPIRQSNPHPSIRHQAQRSFFKRNNQPPENSQLDDISDPIHSPFRRKDPYQFVRSVDDIPENSEELIKNIVNKPLPTKKERIEHIIQTQERVHNVSKRQNKRNYQLIGFTLSFVLLVMVSLEEFKQINQQSFPFQDKLRLFPQVINSLLEPTFHDHLNSSLNLVLERSFGKSLDDLHQLGQQQRDYLVISGLFNPSLKDEELIAQFGSQSSLAMGSVHCRLDPFSKVYEPYIANFPVDDDDDLEKYLLIPLESAQNIMRLYLSSLILHLEDQMTVPVYNYLRDSDSTLSLGESKNTFWTFFKDSITECDQSAFQLLMSEIQHEEIKNPIKLNVSSNTQHGFGMDLSLSDGSNSSNPSKSSKPTSQQQVSLRGLRRALVTFHFTVWSILKETARSAPIQLYNQGEEALKERTISELPNRQLFYEQFVHLNPLQRHPDLTLIHSLGLDHESYYSQAVEDMASILRDEPMTLAWFFDTKLREQRQLIARGFSDEPLSGNPSV